MIRFRKKPGVARFFFKLDIPVRSAMPQPALNGHGAIKLKYLRIALPMPWQAYLHKRLI